MDLNQYIKLAGEFLTSEDIVSCPEAKFKILDEGEMVENKFGNQRLHLNGEFDGAKKVFDMSKTNARIVSEKYGSDSKNWIGKELVLETYKTRTSEGKMTLAINVKEAL